MSDARGKRPAPAREPARRPATWLWVAGVAVLTLALVIAQRSWQRLQSAPAPAAATTAVPAATTETAADAAPVLVVGGPAPAVDARTAVQAALREAFAALTPPAGFEAALLGPPGRLQPDLARAVQLATAGGRDGVRALARLEELCRESRTAVAGAATQEPRVLAAATVPTLRPTVQAWIEALRPWRQALASACADPATGMPPPNVVRAQLEPLAASGDAPALYLLSHQLQGSEALQRLRSAALLGFAPAQFELGNAVLSPNNTVPDAPGTQSPLVESKLWVEQAATRWIPARAYLASCLESGCYGERDPAAALVQYDAAGRAGERSALQALASAEAPARLGLTLQDRVQWARLYATLATAGCYGFATPLALPEAVGLEIEAVRALAPGQDADAGALVNLVGNNARAALGCVR